MKTKSFFQFIAVIAIFLTNMLSNLNAYNAPMYNPNDPSVFETLNCSPILLPSYTLLLKHGVEVQLEIFRTIPSTAKVGYSVQFKVKKSVKVNGVEVISVGAMAYGKVITRASATVNTDLEYEVRIEKITTVDGEDVNADGAIYLSSHDLYTPISATITEDKVVTIR